MTKFSRCSGSTCSGGALGRFPHPLLCFLCYVSFNNRVNHFATFWGISFVQKVAATSPPTKSRINQKLRIKNLGRSSGKVKNLEISVDSTKNKILDKIKHLCYFWYEEFIRMKKKHIPPAYTISVAIFFGEVNSFQMIQKPEKSV